MHIYIHTYIHKQRLIFFCFFPLCECVQFPFSVLLLMTEISSLMQYPFFFLSPFLPATKLRINKAALLLLPLYAVWSGSSSCLLAKWYMDIYYSVHSIENRCFALYKYTFSETGYPKIKFWHFIILDTQNKEYKVCCQELRWFIVRGFLPRRI